MPGRRPVLELLRAGAAVRRIVIARGVRPSGVLAEIRRAAAAAGVPVGEADRSEVARLAGAANHQGVVAVAGAFAYTPLEDLLRRPAPCLLFVDGVTDPHNLGSLLRSAEGAGFTGAVVPRRRAAPVTATVRRVASGAAELVPVARVTNLSRALEEAKGAGAWVLGLDAAADTALWDSPLAQPPVAVVVGAEGAGLSAGVRRHCDALVTIPMAGRLSSLNVAVAGAVAMFEVARRRHVSATL